MDGQQTACILSGLPQRVVLHYLTISKILLDSRLWRVYEQGVHHVASKQLLHPARTRQLEPANHSSTLKPKPPLHHYLLALMGVVALGSKCAGCIYYALARLCSACFQPCRCIAAADETRQPVPVVFVNANQSQWQRVPII